MSYNKNDPPILSIMERLGGFSWCKGTAFLNSSQTFLKKNKFSFCILLTYPYL